MLLATRNLTFLSNSDHVSIPIQISTPESHEKGWRCSYSIGWPHGSLVSEGWGIDPIQALWLTLQKIGTDIYVSPYHRSGKLSWIERGRGYGFPLPDGMRDLAIGDDAR